MLLIYGNGGNGWQFFLIIGTANGLLHPDVTEYVHFRKRQKHVPRNFSSSLRSNWIQALRKFFLNYVHLKRLYKKSKDIGIFSQNSALIKSLK